MSNRRNYTLKDITAHYDGNRRRFDKAVSLWVYYVTRPLSFSFTWLFLRVGISANGATLVSLAVGLLACGLLASGSMGAAILGAILYSGFLVVDSVDGNIARLLKTSSKKGEFLDALVGDLVGMALLPSIAVGLALRDAPLPAPVARFVPADPGLALILASLAASLCHQSVLLLFQRKKVILAVEGPKKPTDFGTSSSPLKAAVLMAGRNLTGFPFLAPAILVFAFADSLWILVGYLALSNLALFAASLAYGFRICLIGDPVRSTRANELKIEPKQELHDAY